MFNPTAFNDVLTPTPVVDMPTVLRLVYTRFAAQEALSSKLSSEVAEEAFQQYPLEDSHVATDAPADELARRPDVDV